MTKLLLLLPVFLELSAGADLYLLAGRAQVAGGFGSVLYRVQEGRTHRLRIVNPPDEPSEFILSNPDAREIVIGAAPGGILGKLYFISMEKPDEERSWDIRSPDQTFAGGFSYTRAFFFVDPAVGSTRFGMQLYREGKDLFLAVRDKGRGFSFEPLPRDILAYAQVYGRTGNEGGQAGTIPLDFHLGSAGASGRVPLIGGAGIEVLHDIPFKKFLEHGQAGEPLSKGSILVRNKDVTVVGRGVKLPDGSGRPDQTFLIRNEQSKSWSSWFLSTWRFSEYIAAFGPWIVGTETVDEPRTGVREQDEQRYRRTTSTLEAEGPDPSDTHTITGPTFRRNERDRYRLTRPGRIHLRHEPTQSTILLAPGHPDSEVLLIHDGTIYFRVNDELRSAPISTSGVGQPSVLAKGEEILDVHWAFLK